MFKTIRDMTFGAIVAGAIGAAMAGIVGTQPGTGFQLNDGAWLNGLASGNNNSFQSGVTAAGTTAATCTIVNPNVYMVEIDTVAASTGVCLSFAVAPDVQVIRNAGAQTLTIYPNPATNVATATTDTINGGTSVAVLTNKSAFCFVAKSGIWSCILSS
jgi:hypothetical protein